MPKEVYPMALASDRVTFTQSNVSTIYAMAKELEDYKAWVILMENQVAYYKSYKRNIT